MTWHKTKWRATINECSQLEIRHSQKLAKLVADKWRTLGLSVFNSTPSWNYILAPFINHIPKISWEMCKGTSNSILVYRQIWTLDIYQYINISTALWEGWPLENLLPSQRNVEKNVISSLYLAWISSYGYMFNIFCTQERF